MARNTKLTRAVQLALVAAAVYGTAAVAQEGEIEQIVVTGSRISRPDLQEASPIQSIGAQEIALQGTANVENILNTLPQVVGATTQTSNNPGGGVATVNLRNLGTQRTLVLVDGRRYISYDTDQVVDLNTIPTALIERIDVVTGGRSAVYGSDAMAGVVNFIMKKNFEGVELNSGYEISDQGDGARENVSATLGGNFADGKGNAVLFGDWTRRDAVFADARSFTKRAIQDNRDGTFIYGGSGSIPAGRVSVPGLNAAMGLGGTFIKFDPNGVGSRYVATDAYNFAPSNYLQVPQERYTVAGMAHYEINDHFKPYMEAQFVNNRVDNELAPTPIAQNTPQSSSPTGTINIVPLHVYSPFIDAATRAAMISLDTDGDGYINATGFGRRLVEVGSRQSLFDRNAYRVVGGMEGNIWGDWNYDTYFMKSRTTNSVVQNGNVSISKFLAGVKTAFMNADGEIQAQPWNIEGLPNGGAGTLVCAPGSPAGCVPINIYGAGNISQEAVDYMKIGTINTEFAETQVVSASIVNSNLFDWGAGPIGLAFGWENRQEKGAFQPDQYLSSGDVAGFNPGLPTKGQYSVSDLFLELNVPIVSGVTGINKLEFNGAVRLSDYSNSVGNVSTYAAGFVYEPVKGLGLRAQYQRAIRGPSISELYLGNTVSFDGAIDPCTDGGPVAVGSDLYNACLATGVPAAQIGVPFEGDTSIPATQGGNANLSEETSDTYTIGLVIQPTFFDNFVTTIDYYNIKIDNVIATVGAQNIVDACYVYGASQYCGQITRGESGRFAIFDDKNQNAASLETEGVDLQMTYNIDLLGNSNLAFSLLGTYVIKNDYTPIVGLPIVNECAGAFGRNCGDPDPEWRHNFRTTWTTGPFTASAMWRHLGSATDDDKTITYYREKFDAIDYFDLAFGYDFGDHVSANLGIDNVANKEPQLGASTQQGGNVQQSNTYPATYDVLGRYWWMTLRLKF